MILLSLQSAWLAAVVTLFARDVSAQDDADVGECALNCLSDNVAGTGCAISQWSCLCPNATYIEQANACIYAACDGSQEEAAFSAIAELCNIFGVPLTVGPQATVSLPTSTPILETQGTASASSVPDMTADSTTNLLGSSSNSPSDSAAVSTTNLVGSSPNFTPETATETATAMQSEATSAASSEGLASETGNAGVKGVSQVPGDSVVWLLFAYLGYLVGA